MIKHHHIPKFTRSVRIVMLILTCFCQISPTPGQVTSARRHINFFLDCEDCDFDFVRQNMEFVSFVRDPKLADVHILSSESPTGSGGTKYFLNFIGRNTFDGSNLEYIYYAGQSETWDETRRGLFKLIQAGVLHYIAQSGNINQFEIDLNNEEIRQVSETLEDRWKKWVFQIEAGGWLQKEASQNEYSLNTELEAEKVTRDWKTKFEANYDIDRENYFDEGLKISNRQVRTNIWGEYIKSLSTKWSAGLFTGYSSDTYVNEQYDLDFDVGIEYNIFPWDISNRKVFTFGYRTGVSLVNYYEETIYNRMKQTLAEESLQLELMLVQPWGTVETRIEGSHYFHDFSKNSLELNSQISVRLTRQLSVYSELNFQVVHDQLYLPKGEASLEDVLLRRRKMATNYELWAELGISFTFGSIYSNVVNERM